MIFRPKVILYRLPDFPYWMAKFISVSGRHLGSEQTAMRVDMVSKGEARARMVESVPGACVTVEEPGRFRKLIAKITGT